MPIISFYLPPLWACLDSGGKEGSNPDLQIQPELDFLSARHCLLYPALSRGLSQSSWERTVEVWAPPLPLSLCCQSTGHCPSLPVLLSQVEIGKAVFLSCPIRKRKAMSVTLPIVTMARLIPFLQWTWPAPNRRFRFLHWIYPCSTQWSYHC